MLAIAGRSPDRPCGCIPAATRSTCVKRSIETTRTSCSTRSTPRAGRCTRHRAPRCKPTFGGVVTTRPPGRAPERDGAGRTTWSSFDHDGNAGGRARHRVDVSLALPRQRVPQPPPLRLEKGERPPHLVLRAGADSTATSERKPVPSVETQPDRGEEQQPGQRRRSRACNHKPAQRGDDASQARFAGVSEPAILLTACVVHPATASSP
jgi:hypothetical protein